MQVHEKFGDRVRRRREELKLKQDDLATAVGISQVAINKIEAGGNTRFGRKIAAALQTTLEYLETGAPVANEAVSRSLADIDQLASDVGEPIELKGMRRLPVVGEVKGGDDGFLDEYQYPVGYGDGYIEYPTSDPNAYALRVRGDSMHPRYRAGEFVVIEPGIEAQDGDDVIVICSNGKKMLKQLNWHRDGEVQLLSVNNGYGPLTIPCTEMDSIQLVAGRARRNALKG